MSYTDPKTIYNIQRAADGSVWEEIYLSGSNLVLQTDAQGTLVGSSTLPAIISVVSSSYSSTSSFALNTQSIPTGGLVITASGALTNETASYAMTAGSAVLVDGGIFV